MYCESLFYANYDNILHLFERNEVQNLLHIIKEKCILNKPLLPQLALFSEKEEPEPF